MNFSSVYIIRGMCYETMQVDECYSAENCEGFEIPVISCSFCCWGAGISCYNPENDVCYEWYLTLSSIIYSNSW